MTKVINQSTTNKVKDIKLKVFGLNEVAKGSKRSEAIKLDSFIVEVKEGGSRRVSDQFLMTKVTGLTPESISDIAETSVKAVKAANQVKGE